ncbi:MAG: DM13 domain-containing protein [Pseudomonadota bacterium]
MKKLLRLTSVAVALLFAVALDASAETLTGTFEGRSDHVVRGTVTIEPVGGGYQVVLSEDFFLDGAPDPKLAFGQDGIAEDTIFVPLGENTGSQTYALPDTIDPTQYNEFYVWCEQFSVPLGFASLN